MTILIALYEWLIASGYVSALVSTRIYFERAPANPTFPYVVLGIDSSTPQTILTGESGAEKTMVAIECFGRDPKGGLTVGRVAETIRNRISGYQGLWGDVYVGECIRESSFTDSQQPRDGSDDWTHRHTSTYGIHFNQSIPSFS